MKIERLRLLNGIQALKGVDSVVAREDMLIERLEDGSGDYVVRVRGQAPVLVPRHVVHFAFVDVTSSKVPVSELKNGPAPIRSA